MTEASGNWWAGGPPKWLVVEALQITADVVYLVLVEKERLQHVRYRSRIRTLNAACPDLFCVISLDVHFSE